MKFSFINFCQLSTLKKKKKTRSVGQPREISERRAHSSVSHPSSRYPNRNIYLLLQNTDVRFEGGCRSKHRCKVTHQYCLRVCFVTPNWRALGSQTQKKWRLLPLLKAIGIMCLCCCCWLMKICDPRHSPRWNREESTADLAPRCGPEQRGSGQKEDHLKLVDFTEVLFFCHALAHVDASN